MAFPWLVPSSGQKHKEAYETQQRVSCRSSPASGALLAVLLHPHHQPLYPPLPLLLWSPVNLLGFLKLSLSTGPALVAMTVPSFPGYFHALLWFSVCQVCSSSTLTKKLLGVSTNPSGLCTPLPPAWLLTSFPALASGPSKVPKLTAPQLIPHG